MSYTALWIRWTLLFAAICVGICAPGLADDAAEIASLNAQVSKLFRAGKYAEARPFAEKALKWSETTNGPDHPITAFRLDDLATIHKSMGAYSKAEPLYQRALAIREKALGPDHRDTAASLNNLAMLYQAMGDYAKALPLFLRAQPILEKALGPNDPGIANIVGNLGGLYQAAGDYAKAEPLLIRALAIREKTLGPRHLDTALSCNNLASLYAAMGDYAKAEPLYQRALAIYEKAMGAQHPGTASILYNLAALYAAMGDYPKAEPLFRHALAIREKILGPQHTDTATSLDGLAGLYQKMGEYAKAEPLYLQALEIKEKALGPLHPETARCLNDLALLYADTGEYGKAEPLYQRAVAANEKAFGSRHPEAATSLGNLAGLYQKMGEYEKAEPLFTQALEIKEKALGPMHPDTARSLNNLALLYVDTGDSAKAEPLYQRALAIDEKALGPRHPDTAVCLNNLAALYMSMGDYAKAEPLYLRALAISEKALDPQHRDIAASLNNLAFLYQTQGDYAKAEPLYQHALAIHEKALGPLHPSTATSLNNLAELYSNMGDYAKAQPLFQRALEIREKALGALHPDTAASLDNLAGLYQLTGDYEKAGPLYQRALAIRDKTLGPQHPATAVSLGNLALMDIATGKTAAALDLIRRAAKAETAHLGNILSFTSEQQRLAFQKTANPDTLPATLGSAPDIAEAVLHNKGVVLDSLLEDRLVAEAGRDAAHRKVIDQIRVAKKRLTQTLLEAPKDVSAAALKRRDAERETRAAEVERLEAGLAREVAGLGKARSALSITVTQVQSLLASDQALIEMLRYSHYMGYGQGETRYGAVVIASTGGPLWVPLGAASAIEKTVLTYGKAVRGELDETTLKATLRALHGQLWAPIEKALPPGVRTVILSPDGDLNFVSFATLMAPDDRFLAEKYSVRYVASGRDLVRELRPSLNKSMVLFGDPDFGGETKLAARRSAAETPDPSSGVGLRDFTHIPLPPLPGAAAECAALASEAGSLGTPSRVFVGAEATEAQLRQTVSPRILHLATHGFFLPEAADPQASGKPNAAGTRLIAGPGAGPRGKQVLLNNPMQRSGLALAGAQRALDAWARGEAPPSDNDGIVTAEEVGGLNLRGAWLVTLSACDTGTGEARAGEGVMGLRRGFIQAGAENLLMTLWAISDETTVEIMKDFYAAALKSGDAPEALAGVQRDWLVKLRQQKSLTEAVTLAGSFIVSSLGAPSHVAGSAATALPAVGTTKTAEPAKPLSAASTPAPSVAETKALLCTAAAPAGFRLNYPYDDPGYRVWTRTNDAWEEKLPSGKVKRFQTTGRDLVDGRSGCIIALQGGAGVEIFVSDKRAKQPQLYYRQARGNWGLLGKMEDIQ